MHSEHTDSTHAKRERGGREPFAEALLRIVCGSAKHTMIRNCIRVCVIVDTLYVAAIYTNVLQSFACVRCEQLEIHIERHTVSAHNTYMNVSVGFLSCGFVVHNLEWLACSRRTYEDVCVCWFFI